MALVGPSTGGLPAGQPITLFGIEYLILRVGSFLITISVTIAVIMIVWAGITYMAAGSDASKVTLAQARLKNGIIGAAVVLGVGVILQTVASVVSGQFFGCRIDVLGFCVVR